MPGSRFLLAFSGYSLYLQNAHSHFLKSKLFPMTLPKSVNLFGNGMALSNDPKTGAGPIQRRSPLWISAPLGSSSIKLNWHFWCRCCRGKTSGPSQKELFAIVAGLFVAAFFYKQGFTNKTAEALSAPRFIIPLFAFLKPHTSASIKQVLFQWGSDLIHKPQAE